MSIEKLKARSETNPFAVKIAKSELTTNSKDVYENLVTRTTVAFNPNRNERRSIVRSLKSLRARMGKDKVFKSHHFGYTEMIRLGDMLINIDNQRDVDWDHVAYILEHFDPRIVQVVNTIRLTNDLYSVPEGQHTVVALYILMVEGLIPADTLIACKVIPADLMVPGSPVKGEGFGNLLFRIINYKGRKIPDPYFMLRSRVNGVRLYNSELQEDVHAERIMTVVENNNMYCRPAVDGRGQGAQPGMITYIAGLLSISEFDSETFDSGIEDLNWALGCHDEKFSRQKGVDGGFILGFGRYAKLARKTKVNISATHRAALLDFIQETYGSPAKFHKECKKRLKNFQREYQLKEAWSDSCVLSVLIIDFDAYCTQKGESYPVLNDLNLNKFKSI